MKTSKPLQYEIIENINLIAHQPKPHTTKVLASQL